MNCFENHVILGDCLSTMNGIPKEQFDLIFADPPFNIGIKYDNYKDNLEYDSYYEWSNSWITECVRLLKPHGSMYVAIGDEFAAELNLILKKSGLNFRNWIIWYYTFGQNQRKKFNRSHTHILYYSKSSNKFVFNDREIRIPSARQTIYNDKRANPLGKIPDDVWQFSRLCGTFKERKIGHPCQMPESLLERIIKVSTNEGDLIFDPFGGTGTTAYTAQKNNRKYFTIEISEKYYNIILNRLN